MTPTPTPISLVGLSGYAGAGKDAAAAVLLDQGWARIGFADKLRDVAYALDPLIPVNDPVRTERLAWLVDRYGWERTKRDHPEVRRLLQRLGTEGGRKVLGENVWVDAALLDGVGPAVITDVRFVNEADAIRDRGGVVLRIERPGVGPTVRTDGHIHPSETALDGFDFDAVLNNSGTLDDLHALVVEALAWVGTPRARR